jgi:PAS domain S-box-containing protein
LLVYVSVAVATLLAVLHLVGNALQSELSQAAKREGHLLSSTIAPLLVQRDAASAADLLGDMVADGSMVYLEVRNSAGELFARAGVPAGTSTPQPAAPSGPARSLRAVDGVFHFEGDVVLDQRRLGGFRFGVSEKPLLAAQRQAALGVLAVTLLGLVAAVLASWLLARLLTRRLQVLTDAVDRLAGGGMAETLPVQGSDEPARLALSFNRMSQALQQRIGALRDSELRQRQLIDSMSEGVVFQDASDKVLECNDAACQTLGLTRGQLLGSDSMDPRWHANAPDGTPFDFSRHPSVIALRTGRPVRDVLMAVHRPDGSQVWLSINSQPLQAPGADLPHATVTCFSDVTTRIEAERSLLLTNEQLERRVSERTTELAAARDAAEHANRAKTDFLSSISHELRTPLNAILGFSQVLRMGERGLPPSADEQLGHIETAGWHLLQLINDVLDLSRIESGSLVISSDAVQIAPLVSECLRMVEGAARSAQLSLQADEVDPALAILGDATRLRQVLVNLLSNACKYNRPGGRVRLHVRAMSGQVIVEVSDTGPGLSAEQQASLYEPFNRLGAERGTVQGTGIGLVITRRLVELMQGRLDLDSVVGSGSTFRVTLRRAALAPPPPQPTADMAAAADVAARWTLLYVEDNVANQDLLTEVLRLRPRVRLLVAADGPRGLALATAQRPDLVVVDVSLPGMDGYELCRRMRALPALRGQPIVALSANAMAADRARGLAAGFDRYFTKPLNVSQFLAWLDKAVQSLEDVPP